MALLVFFRNGSRHGYDIYRQLNTLDGLGQVWRLKPSQLYALLGRLEQVGYLVSTRQDQPDRPPRKVFTLSPLGEISYLEWIQRPVLHGRQFRLEFLAKLYCALKENPGMAVQLIVDQRNTCKEWLNTGKDRSNSSTLFLSLVHDYRAGQIRAMISWLDECERVLEDSLAT